VRLCTEDDCKECGVRSAECRVRSAECGVWSMGFAVPGLTGGGSEAHPSRPLPLIRWVSATALSLPRGACGPHSAPRCRPWASTCSTMHREPHHHAPLFHPPSLPRAAPRTRCPTHRPNTHPPSYGLPGGKHAPSTCHLWSSESQSTHARELTRRWHKANPCADRF